MKMSYVVAAGLLLAGVIGAVPNAVPAHADSLSQAEIDRVLELHNTVRAKHHAPALTWNAEAASFAKKWADRCEFGHSPDRKYGENIAMGYRSWDEVMKGWVDDEEPKYDYDAGEFSPETGHFTQVVWKATTQVGVAVAQCPDGPFYVAEYSPPGNVRGQFKQNVLPK
ncbi:CAP family protein [Nocardia sp. NPDC049149]|uniref:CAP family protein n=1 Tax=Nocardia sp. NPDC049149 TaxID=3364315 RepID=UPI00371AF4A6